MRARFVNEAFQEENKEGKKGFFSHIEKETVDNNYFRKVLYTGEGLQLVLMTLQPGEEIGLEVHPNDQFFRFEEGSGEVLVNDAKYTVKDGDSVIIPLGSEHNIINTGNSPLKMYTLYGPPHHKDRIIHRTKEEAENSDEEFDGQLSESLSPSEKREEVMQILKDRKIEVPHDSYVKFFDLSLRDLTPEEIVAELIKESQDFERGSDPQKAMGVGLKNMDGYIKMKLRERFPNEDPQELLEAFWSFFAMYWEDESPDEVADHFLNYMKKHIPLKYQIEYIEEDIKEYIDQAADDYDEA